MSHYIYLGYVPVAKIETRHDNGDAAGWMTVQPSLAQRYWRNLMRLAGVHVDDQPLHSTGSARSLYVHTDHLGTPKVVSDETQATVWEMEHTSFGSSRPEDDGSPRQSVSLNLRFAGQYFDQESGFHYNIARYYVPDIGRYSTSDPIGLAGGVNTYAYVGSNPLRYVDPFGLYTEVIVWDPVGQGSSSFGHISTNIDGRNYSWGPSGWDRTFASAASYIARQQEFRGGIGYILSLTVAQERALASCLRASVERYSMFSNNCGTPIQKCLRQVGVAVGQSVLPHNVGNDLSELPNLAGTTVYAPPVPDPGPTSLPVMP